MATGDKLVNLDDLKVAYDKQQEDTNALKSAMSNGYIASNQAVYTEKRLIKTATCVQNGIITIPIWDNPFSILRAGKTYLFKASLSNASAEANIHARNNVGSQIFLHLEGTATTYGFVNITEELGNIYVYANAVTDITVEVFTEPENEEYSWQASAYDFEAFQFPFKKERRYSVTLDFGGIIELTNFGMSINTNYNWNRNYTPITERIFKGNKIERHFTSKDDYDFVIFKLTGITAGQNMTVTIKEISGAPNPGNVVVAASDAPYDDKMAADFVCSGNYDEYMIVFAYEYAYWSKVGTVKLTNGKFNIQSFPFTYHNVKCAIPLRVGTQANGGKDMVIRGSNCAYGFNGSRFPNGTVLYVDETGYNSIGSNESVSLFMTTGATSILSGCAIMLEDFGIYIYGSQKKLTAIDLIGGDRIYLNRLVLVGYTKEMIDDPAVGLTYPPIAIPVEGFTGVKLGTGSNDPIGYTLRNVGVWGFYEAFKVGGEHLLMEQCSAAIGVYGYTFGNYDYGDNPNTIVHPITMINCCDERNQNFPLFKKCGYGLQVTMIDFNLEQVTDKTPGGVFYNYMKDETGGRVCGEISYTIMTAWTSTEAGGNVVNKKLWADGNGQRFITRNAAQKLTGTTAERLSYAANYHQQFFDTDLNKLVICTDPAINTWVDTMGEVVD